ncbi:MAG: transposase [Bryobacteraceae bacterium]
MTRTHLSDDRIAPNQNRDHEGAAVTYLLTWVCYGAWLLGQTGAVRRTRNQYGAPVPEPDAKLERRSRYRMTQEPYSFDSVRQQIVLQSLQEACFHSGWTLWATHVRTNHVHVVLTANSKPEQIMTTLKAYSSRALNHCARGSGNRRRWARHGSTRYLWTKDAVRAALQYVVHEQGKPTALFEIPLPLSEPRP